jgi:hypothetical protein
MRGWSQEPPLRDQTAHPAPRLDKGSVGGIYKNPSIGLELIPDPKLKLGTPALKGKPGDASSSLAIIAVGKFRSGSVRELTAFLGNPVRPISCRRAFNRCRYAKSCRGRSERRIKSHPKFEWRVGGTWFARMDFSQRDHPVYEAVFVKACETLALGFGFAGSDQDAVNKIIAATDVN